MPLLGTAPVPVEDWTTILGREVFGIEDAARTKFSPRFRSLAPFFMRLKGGFDDPFETFPKQQAWQKDVFNTFLLGLPWEISLAFRHLQERRTHLKQIEEAGRTGELAHLAGNLGLLETEAAVAGSRVARLEKDVSAFRVHPEYETVRAEADRLTRQMQSLRDEDVIDHQVLDGYRRSMTAEPEEPVEDLAAVYEEAGLVFPGALRRSLIEVQAFHSAVVAHRRAFLADEVRRLERAIADRDKLLRELDVQRQRVTEILRTTGALDEYTALQSRLSDARSRLDALNHQVRSLQGVEKARADLEADEASLAARLVTEDQARGAIRSRALGLFRTYSSALVEGGGTLTVHPGRRGYAFEHDVPGKTSEGRRKLAVFCYDLVLATLWREQGKGLGFLVHDSESFSGMDPLQLQYALNLAARHAGELGIQHIMTLGDHKLEGFDADPFSCLELHDKDASGSLLGFRYETPSRLKGVPLPPTYEEE